MLECNCDITMNNFTTPKRFKSTYQKYLASQHWINTRNHHYKNQKNRLCFICSGKIRLNVHHMIYRDNKGKTFLWRENDSILKTLCGTCHIFYHKYINKYSGTTRYLYRIRNLIYLGVDKEKAFINSISRKLYKKLYNKAKGNLNNT